jgi:hypothetical protein
MADKKYIPIYPEKGKIVSLRVDPSEIKTISLKPESSLPEGVSTIVPPTESEIVSLRVERSEMEIVSLRPEARRQSLINVTTSAQMITEAEAVIGRTSPYYHEGSGAICYTDMDWLSRYPHHYVGLVEFTCVVIKARIGYKALAPNLRASLVLGNGPESSRVKMPLLFLYSDELVKDYVVWFSKNRAHDDEPSGEQYKLLKKQVANNLDLSPAPTVRWSVAAPVVDGTLRWPCSDGNEVMLADQSIWWGHPLDTDIFDHVEIRTDETDSRRLQVYSVKILLNSNGKLANPYDESTEMGDRGPNFWPAPVSVTKYHPLVLDSMIENYGLWRIGYSTNPILRYAVRDLAQSWSPKYFPIIPGWEKDETVGGTGDWKKSRLWWSSDFTSTVVRRSTDIQFPLVGERQNGHYISYHADMRDYYFAPRGEWISNIRHDNSPAVSYRNLGSEVKPGYFIIGARDDHSAIFIRWYKNKFDSGAAWNRFHYIDGNSGDRVRVHDNGWVTSEIGDLVPIPKEVGHSYIVWYNNKPQTDGFGRLVP